MELGYALAGSLVGFIVGLTGVGGGSLMTPLLIISPRPQWDRPALCLPDQSHWRRVHARRGNVE